MKMQTGNDYLPEWLVYLFGKMAHFPQSVGSTVLTIQSLAPGQASADKGKLIQLLLEMHRECVIELTDIKIDQDLLKYAVALASKNVFGASQIEKYEAYKRGWTPLVRKKIGSDDELNFDVLAGAVQKLPVGFLDRSLRFQLVIIDSEWFRTELEEYLQKFKNGDLTKGNPDDPHTYTKQLDLLVESYWRQSREYGDKHNQKCTDIWRGSESRKQGRFWELVFTAAKDRYFKLLAIHQESVPWVRIEALEAIKVHKTAKQRVNEFKLHLLSQRPARQTVSAISTSTLSTAPAKPTSGWLDEQQGRYQFGEKSFEQHGAIRGKVFRALMNLHEVSPLAIQMAALHGRTGLAPRQIRIEISAINKRLLLQGIGYQFVGSHKGYYTLDPVDKTG